MCKHLVCLIALTVSAAAHAEGPSCNAAAAEKKLAGAKYLQKR